MRLFSVAPWGSKGSGRFYVASTSFADQEAAQEVCAQANGAQMLRDFLHGVTEVLDSVLADVREGNQIAGPHLDELAELVNAARNVLADVPSVPQADQPTEH